MEDVGKNVWRIRKEEQPRGQYPHFYPPFLHVYISVVEKQFIHCRYTQRHERQKEIPIQEKIIDFTSDENSCDTQGQTKYAHGSQDQKLMFSSFGHLANTKRR